MITDPKILSSIEKSLEREIYLYERYREALVEERKSITKFDEAKVLAFTEKRSELLDAMHEAQERRKEILSKIPESQGIRLSELIDQRCLAGDRKRLLPLIEKLRTLVQDVQALSKSSSGVVRFAMGVVDSLLSIFWSATQHVSKSYSRQGVLQEKAQPAGDRKSSILKSA